MFIFYMYEYNIFIHMKNIHTYYVCVLYVLYITYYDVVKLQYHHFGEFYFKCLFWTNRKRVLISAERHK